MLCVRLYYHFNHQGPEKKVSWQNLWLQRKNTCIFTKFSIKSVFLGAIPNILGKWKYVYGKCCEVAIIIVVVVAVAVVVIVTNVLGWMWLTNALVLMCAINILGFISYHLQNAQLNRLRFVNITE